MALGPADEAVLRPGRPVSPGREAAGPSPTDDSPLLAESEAERFSARWSEVQARFVDDPQGAVRDGDALVGEVLRALTDRFAEHRDGLEASWRSGAEPSTERLRQALQSYRSFFSRLLRT